MRKIRIGKDINLRWHIEVPDGGGPLSDMDLSLYMNGPQGMHVLIENATIGVDTIEFTLRGTLFSQLGDYSLTCWKNKGEQGQTVLDAVRAFALVKSSDQEADYHECGCNELELATVDLRTELQIDVLGYFNDPAIIARIEALEAGGGGGSSVDVVDSLTSDSATDALAARQGKVLMEEIEAKANSTDVANSLSGKQDKIDESNKLPAASVDGLADVATSGNYDDLTNKPTIADTETINVLLTSSAMANNIITADVSLPLHGYISQATHQFVDTSNDDKYKCSGLVYVKGFTTIEFSARAYSEDSDSCQMVFFDSAKNVIPSLDICVNDGITRTIDLTSQGYESVSYIIMSAYMPGWSGNKTYLRVKGSYNFQDFIDKSNLAYKQGFNMFDINRVERGMGLSSTGVYNVDNQAISSHLIELNEDRGRNGDLFLFNLPVTTYTKRFVYYDEHMNIVAGPSDVEAASTSAQIGCPAAARYFRITFVRATDPLPDETATTNMLKDVMITFQYSMEEYQKYYRNIESVNGDRICAASISNLYKGKKWVCVGDSLTERNNHSAKFYHDYVKEDLGFDVINMGVSGTGYKTRDDVASPTTEGAFYQRVAQIPSDTDVVTIFGSFNDVTQGHTLGTASDTGTATIGGCINETIEAIYSINPGVKLGIIAPCPWKEMNPASPDAIAYVALLQEICNKNSIPFLDLFHNSGLRPWIKAVRDELYNQDAQTNDDFHGTHPNSKGHELLASKIKVFIQSLI